MTDKVIYTILGNRMHISAKCISVLQKTVPIVQALHTPTSFFVYEPPMNQYCVEKERMKIMEVVFDFHPKKGAHPDC